MARLTGINILIGHRKAGIDTILCPAYFYSSSMKIPRGKIPSSKAWNWIQPQVKREIVQDDSITKDNGNGPTREFLEERYFVRLAV